MRTQLSLALLIGMACGFAAGATSAQVQQLTQKHDSKQPIQISADSLEVEQDKQLATFRGNVDAVQGEIRLRADTLRVHYRSKDSSGGKAAAAPGRNAAAGAAAAADPLAAGAISRIDADGNVIITSPDESARGSSGFYDVDKASIVLDGSPVVLTRGQNVLTGNRAVINLDTGKSTLVPVPGQRVNGMFVPEQKGAPEPQAKARK